MGGDNRGAVGASIVCLPSENDLRQQLRLFVPDCLYLFEALNWEAQLLHSDV